MRPHGSAISIYACRINQASPAKSNQHRSAMCTSSKRKMAMTEHVPRLELHRGCCNFPSLSSRCWKLQVSLWRADCESHTIGSFHQMEGKKRVHTLGWLVPVACVVPPASRLPSMFNVQHSTVWDTKHTRKAPLQRTHNDTYLGSCVVLRLTGSNKRTSRSQRRKLQNCHLSLGV